MQNIPTLLNIPNPHTFEISLKERNYLENIQDPIFKSLNENYKDSLRLFSDQILVLIILICRHNQTYPKDPLVLIPLILTHNSNPNLN